MVKNLRLLLVKNLLIMMILKVMVMETLATMEIPLLLTENLQVNMATTQGEMLKDQLVGHNIPMNFKANHQDQIFQDRLSGIKLTLLS